MKNGNMKVCVCGGFASGRHSLINVLLGKQVVRTSAVPHNEGKMIELSYSEVPETIVHFTNGVEKKHNKEYINVIPELSDSIYAKHDLFIENIKNIKIGLPLESLRGLEILLPKEDISCTNSKEDFLNLLGCDVIIYVMSACRMWTRWDCDQLQSLKELVSNITIAYTMWDQVIFDCDDAQKVKLMSYTNTMAIKYGVPSDACFYLDNRAAIKAIEQNDTEAYSKTGFPELEKFLTDTYIKLRSEEKK